MFNGYAGKILRVDLTTRNIRAEDLTEGLIKDYVGGVGFGTYFLTREVHPSIEPLGPQNKIIFSTGPLCGLGVPTASRWSVTTKSPLGIWGEGLGGGFFGPEMKFSGYDAIIFEGVSEKPVYLYVNNGYPELRDAGHLWGLDTYETILFITREVMESRVRVACIGPAGENQCHIAGIMSDPDSGAWRGGLGAVMGSKRLKAVAVRGKVDRLPPAHPEALDKAVRLLLFDVFGKNSLVRDFSDLGGMQILTALNKAGILPAYNWRDGIFEGTENFDGAKVKGLTHINKWGCMDCVVRCRANVKVEEGPYAGFMGYRPQFDPACAVGPLCGVGELGFIIKATSECNRLGMCGVSAGATIAFAMECYEKGLITKRDTGGIDLRWGNTEAILQMLGQMARKEGFGRVLGDGTGAAARRIGKGSEDFAVHVKGLEPYTYDARGAWGMGMAYATSNRGACGTRQAMINLDLGSKYALGGGGEGLGGYHPEIGITPEKYSQFKIDNKAQALIHLQNMKSIIDSAIVCNIIWRRISDLPSLLPKFLYASTGIPVSRKEMMERGERIFNMQRMFNVKAGIRRKDDYLPKRFLEHPLKKGNCEGRVFEKFDEWLTEYYQLRGWDEEGVPKKETVDRLNIAQG